MARAATPPRVLCLLAAAVFVRGAGAQFFSEPVVSADWWTDQTSRTFDSANGAVLCDTPWNGHFATTGTNLLVDETRAEGDGGCPLVALGRIGTFTAAVDPAASASLGLETRIEASTITEVARWGSAAGSMHGSCAASFRVDRWCTADALVRFIADAGRQASTTSLAARFLGPLDPATGEPVLTDASWTGTTRQIFDLEGVLLAPGVYQIRADAEGAFLNLLVHRFVAPTAASAVVDNPAPASPPPAWDLDGDGLVGLSDACLWSDNPTDADGDGQTGPADLALIMALARAGGQNATDADGDGLPDQCGAACPADFNTDGHADFFDVQAFLAAFAAGDPRADMNGDANLDFFDLLAFLGLFSDGC
jgi:hypothetical protein